MIAAGMEQFQAKKWSSLLPRISFNLNTSKSTSTKYMPFEIAFNKKPNYGNKKGFFEYDANGNEIVYQISVETVEPPTPAPSTSDAINEIDDSTDSDIESENEISIVAIIFVPLNFENHMTRDAIVRIAFCSRRE